MIERELVIEQLNSIVHDKVDDPDKLRPYYAVSKENDKYILWITVGEEQYSIYQTSSEENIETYIRGMIRGLKIERKPVWKN